MIRKSLSIGAFLFIAACDSGPAEPLPPVSGTLEVTVTTLGEDVDADGYLIEAGGGTTAMGSNATASIELPLGGISVRIVGVAPNCLLTASETVAAEVTVSVTTRLGFTVDCFSKASRVLYVAPRGIEPKADIIVLNPFNGTRTVITPPFEYLRDAAWAQDGSIRFAGTDEPLQRTVEGTGFLIPTLDVYRIGTDGSGLTRLVAAAPYYPTASQSPDGSRVVVSRLSGTQADLWVMNSDGTGQRKLTDTPETLESDPQWAPNGDVIVFTSSLGAESTLESIRADGSGRRTLSTEGITRPFWPRWSPDGTKVAYLGIPSGSTTRHVFASNADGTNTRLLTHAGENAVYLSWASNSRWVTFSRLSAGDRPRALYIASLAGTRLLQLTSTELNSEARWGP